MRALHVATRKPSAGFLRLRAYTHVAMATRKHRSNTHIAIDDLYPLPLTSNIDVSILRAEPVPPFTTFCNKQHLHIVISRLRINIP